MMRLRKYRKRRINIEASSVETPLFIDRVFCVLSISMRKKYARKNRPSPAVVGVQTHMVGRSFERCTSYRQCLFRLFSLTPLFVVLLFPLFENKNEERQEIDESPGVINEIIDHHYCFATIKKLIATLVEV